jgi:hypothetical protein
MRAPFGGMFFASLILLVGCTPSSSGACGTPSANSLCETVTWPRVAIAFGDAPAAGFSYVFRADDGFTSAERAPCPGGYGESQALRCDIGFYANPNERVVTVTISDADGGSVLLSRAIPLTAFNYCGNGIAQVVATISDAGGLDLSNVQYVNACGSP